MLQILRGRIIRIVGNQGSITGAIAIHRIIISAEHRIAVLSHQLAKGLAQLQRHLTGSKVLCRHRSTITGFGRTAFQIVAVIQNAVIVAGNSAVGMSAGAAAHTITILHHAIAGAGNTAAILAGGDHAHVVAVDHGSGVLADDTASHLNGADASTVVASVDQAIAFTGNTAHIISSVKIAIDQSGILDLSIHACVAKHTD